MGEWWYNLNIIMSEYFKYMGNLNTKEWFVELVFKKGFECLTAEKMAVEKIPDNKKINKLDDNFSLGYLHRVGMNIFFSNVFNDEASTIDQEFYAFEMIRIFLKVPMKKEEELFYKIEKLYNEKDKEFVSGQNSVSMTRHEIYDNPNNWNWYKHILGKI